MENSTTNWILKKLNLNKFYLFLNLHNFLKTSSLARDYPRV